MTPHKHAELIKAWADGAQIEFYDTRFSEHKWKLCGGTPLWDQDVKFRIKPKPDFNQTMDVYMNKMYQHYPDGLTERRLMIDNFSLLGTMNLTFDGATGRLKSAEVL